jgi:outer membrane protein OmpA-like peptidoglycan-associated protein/Tol biopolymer transport system component
MYKLKIALSLLVTILCTHHAKTQAVTLEHARKHAATLYMEADRLYAYGRYQEADSLLHQVIKNEYGLVDAHWLLGTIYLENQRKYDDAVTELKAVEKLMPSFNERLPYYLGMALFNKGDYDEAKTYFIKYKNTRTTDPGWQKQAENMANNCDFAKEAVKHPVEFKPFNLGAGVNTSEDDLMPMLTADEHWLYFTRLERIGRAHDENIFVAENRNGAWTMAEPLGETINTLQYNEGAHCISPSGRYLFFTSCDRPDKYGGCDIYFSKRTGSEWDKGKNMGGVINTSAKETQPCLSGDGRTLYFVSSKAGGYGAGDIYVSTIDDKGVWSTPQNLGANINTEMEEERPYIHPDGYTLYFTSRGHAGMGGADLYMSRKQADGTWGKAINLGYPINTPGDEIGIYVTTDGRFAYFASEQPDTKGGMDIYKFDMPVHLRPYIVSYVKGNVTDKISHAPQGARIQFYDIETGAVYATASSDPRTGEYLTTLPAGKNYACTVSKDGFLFYSANFSMKDIKEGAALLVDIPLSKVQVGSAVVLNNVFFETNSYTLKDESKTELGTLLDLLAKNATLKIEIGGHTDNSGTDAENLALSEKRAKSVQDYLLTKGIDASRLTYKGYGATKAIADNKTDAGKSKNRRTEFTVVSL